MKTVVIPTDRDPFTITVGNKDYTYRAGETRIVPDEVAEAIALYVTGKPQHRQYPDADPVLPKITAADEGKVVKVVGGVYVLADIQDAESEEF